jgi:hypothetical protein
VAIPSRCAGQRHRNGGLEGALIQLHVALYLGGEQGRVREGRTGQGRAGDVSRFESESMNSCSG